MKTIIKNKLKELEEKFQVKVLYACETGSRAWGFPSPDSDYDVRMIYMHDIDWYLSLSDKKDSIEFMSEDRELDISGWDIKKCLKLMWKSNGALLERVQSPVIYREEKNIASLLKEYADRCFAPIATMHHYLGMAKNSFAEIEGNDEIKLKKLFYALRATHVPLGIAVTASSERSQMMNKKDATERLKNKLMSWHLEQVNKTTQVQWMEHNLLLRGNPVKVFNEKLN